MIEKEKRLKVLYVADQYSIGGAADALIELINLMRLKYPIQPIVITGHGDALGKRLEKNRIEHYSVGYRQFAYNSPGRGAWRWIYTYLKPFITARYYYANFIALKKINRVMDVHSIDLIHTNVNRNDFGGVISYKYNIPHCWHIREHVQGHFNIKFNRSCPYHYMNQRASAFIAASKDLANDWVGRGILQEKMHVIYDGVDLGEYNKIKKEHKRSRLNIVCIGEVTRAKGQELLLEAAKGLCKKYKQIYIDFYGNGEKNYVNSLIEYTNQEEINENVHFNGYIDNVSDILTQYDIGINPSMGEGFGRTTIEYMASGICTVAYNSDVTKEIIEHGVNGFLYKDLSELISIIESIYLQEIDYKTITEEGCKKAFDKFDMKNQIDEIYQLYLRCIKRNLDTD